MEFSPVALLTELKRLPAPRRYCIGLSGGCDSLTLLHALAAIRQELPCPTLHAIHIDHGLHAESAHWAEHCARVCQQWQISFEVQQVQVPRARGQSLEAEARTVRYQALTGAMHTDDMLLLAHHQDDQAETLLLQMLRGSGVKGLAAMPALTAFGPGWLARPLLPFSRAALVAYARAQQLVWIDDPSNRDTRFDRNYLRQAILPAIQARWPAASATLARVAQHQGEAAGLLDVLAAQDYAMLETECADVIAIRPLQQLDAPRQRNVLRYWLQRICDLPLPNSEPLQRILDEILPAAQDAMPLVHWRGAEVRRFRDRLYAMPALDVPAPDWAQGWDCQGPLVLPTGEQLQISEEQGSGLRAASLSQGVQVRYRRGGEVCRLPGRTHHSELKKLFQDWAIPPWQRARIPLIYVGDELAQIVGYSLCEPFIAGPQEPGLRISLQQVDSGTGH